MIFCISCSHSPNKNPATKPPSDKPTLQTTTPDQNQTTLSSSDQPPFSKITTTKWVNYQGANNFVWFSGNRGLVLTNNHSVDLYQLATSKTFEPTIQILANTPQLLCGSSPGSLVAWVGDENLIHVWDIELHQEQILPGNGTAITGLSFSPNASVVAHANYDNTITIWDVESQQKLMMWKTSIWLSELIFSADQLWIAGVDLENGAVDTFNAQTGEQIGRIVWSDSASPVLYTAKLSPDWSRIAWVARNSVQIMEMPGEQYGPMLTYEDFVSAVAWSPDSQILASAAGASVNGGFFPVVQLWNAQTGVLLATLIQQDATIELSFSPDGRELAILTANGVLQIWSIE